MGACLVPGDDAYFPSYVGPGGLARLRGACATDRAWGIHGACLVPGDDAYFPSYVGPGGLARLRGACVQTGRGGSWGRGLRAAEPARSRGSGGFLG